jgi:hypothetical protein
MQALVVSFGDKERLISLDTGNYRGYDRPGRRLQALVSAKGVWD